MANNIKKELTLVARELFKEFGLKKTTVNDICNKALTSRVTFYKHFTDKNNIAQEIIQETIETYKAQFYKLLNSKFSYDELVINMISGKKRIITELGEKFVADAMTPNSPLFSFLINKQHEHINIYNDFYNKLIEKKLINNRISFDVFMAIIDNFTNLLINPKITETYKTAGEKQEFIAQLIFYGLKGQWNI